MCLHLTIQPNIHKVHTLQVYKLVAKILIENLAYNVSIWQGIAPLSYVQINKVL